MKFAFIFLALGIFIIMTGYYFKSVMLIFLGCVCVVGFSIFVGVNRNKNKNKVSGVKDVETY